MNHQLPSSKYPAIKQLLVNRFQAVLDLHISGWGLQVQPKSHIPLHQAREQQRILYICAIALQLSPAIELPALEIANALASSLGKQQDFTVQVVPPGLIHLELTELLVAAWLQHLTQRSQKTGDRRQKRAKEAGENWEDGEETTPLFTLPPLSPSSIEACHSPLTTNLFPVQYAHARCCSLIQMAHQEELMVLEPANSDSSSALWLAVTPNPIPWLNFEQKLYLYHPAERALMAQLVALLDNLYCPCPSRKPINWYRAALDLSQAFQTFYSYCRIWGEVKSQNLQLAQARLGLVLITQSALRLLLQERLRSIALQEL